MARTIARTLGALRGSFESIPEELQPDEGHLDKLLPVIDFDEEWDTKDELGEEITDAVYGLEQLQERLQKTLASHSTIDSNTLVLAKEAFIATYGRLGSPARTQAALESINNDLPSDVQLTITVETIADTLRALWEGIKRHLKALMDKFERVWERLIYGVEGLRTRAQDLIRESRGFTPKTTGTSMRVTGATLIHYQGRLDAPSVLEGLKNLNQTFVRGYDASTNVAGKYYGQIEDMANHLLKVKTEDEINFHLFETFHEIADEFDYHGPEFSGGYRFVPREAESRSGRDIGYQIVRESTANTAFEMTVGTPTPKDIERIAEQVMMIAAQIKLGRTRLRTIKREQDDCIRAIDKLIRQSEDGFSEKVVTRRLATKIARHANNSIAAPLARLNILGFQAARSALVYGESALAAIRGGSTQ